MVEGRNVEKEYSLFTHFKYSLCGSFTMRFTYESNNKHLPSKRIAEISLDICF